MSRPLPPPWYREIAPSVGADGPYVFSCEHASNNFGPVAASGTDRALLDQHWAFDLGAAELTTALVEQTRSVGILSTYSRLLLDPNRLLSSSSLFVDTIEGQPVLCNQTLDDAERAERIKCLHKGYHDGLDQLLKRRLAQRDVALISLHSFTPVWSGRARDVEIGVLFDEREEEAHALVDFLRAQGYDCRPNEPYSGVTGELMYAANRHGHAHNIPYIEFEVRQDLLSSQAGVTTVSAALQLALDTHFRPLVDTI